MAEYFFSSSSVNIAAFFVVSTSNWFSSPNFWMAAIPAGMEECLNPMVLENTKTLGAPSRFLLSHPINSSTVIERNKAK